MVNEAAGTQNTATSQIPAPLAVIVGRHSELNIQQK
jgi:hypothetical protein